MEDHRDLLHLKVFLLERYVGNNRSSRMRAQRAERTVVHNSIQSIDASLNYMYEPTDFYMDSRERTELPHFNREQVPIVEESVLK